MLQTWDMLVFVARLRKKEIILGRTLAKSVEKTKLQNIAIKWKTKLYIILVQN